MLECTTKVIKEGENKMKINPIKLIGEWDEGYALDRHTISSIPLGEDVYGHMQFETRRSELGELVYGLKYKGKYNDLQNIMDGIKPFLDEWSVLKTIDVILPVPPSIQRQYQPVTEIAQAIATYLNVSFTDQVLRKSSDEQSKNMERDNKELSGTIISIKKAKRPFNILLVDDLYSTDGTITECVRILRQDPNLQQIYILTMTKTR